MALITCPECNKPNVSDKADICPACGFGIKKHFDELYIWKIEQQKIDGIGKLAQQRNDETRNTVQQITDENEEKQKNFREVTNEENNEYFEELAKLKSVT